MSEQQKEVPPRRGTIAQVTTALDAAQRAVEYESATRRTGIARQPAPFFLFQDDALTHPSLLCSSSFPPLLIIELTRRQSFHACVAQWKSVGFTIVQIGHPRSRDRVPTRVAFLFAENDKNYEAGGKGGEEDAALDVAALDVAVQFYHSQSGGLGRPQSFKRLMTAAAMRARPPRSLQALRDGGNLRAPRAARRLGQLQVSASRRRAFRPCKARGAALVAAVSCLRRAMTNRAARGLANVVPTQSAGSERARANVVHNPGG